MRLYFSTAEKYAVLVLLVALLGGVITLAWAGGRSRHEHANETPFLQPPAAPTAPAAPAAPAELAVHVTGAVRHSGVYRFLTGARVDDALRQAGGATDDGYPDALNLAARLEDGERIYVPTKAEWQKMTANADPPPARHARQRGPARRRGTSRHHRQIRQERQVRRHPRRRHASRHHALRPERIAERQNQPEQRHAGATPPAPQRRPRHGPAHPRLPRRPRQIHRPRRPAEHPRHRRENLR